MSRHPAGRGSFGARLDAATGASWGLDRGTLERLDALDQFVERFDRNVNLTGFRSSEVRLCRYFGEALAVLHALLPLPTGAAVDVGSGGGTPALPLAIARPELSWTLVEPRRKRAMFLEQASHELGILNVKVYHGRLEAYAEAGAPASSCITVRGLGLDVARRDALMRLVATEGRILLLSGERRLRDEALAWSEVGARVDGPWPLLPRAVVASGWMLQVETS